MYEYYATIDRVIDGDSYQLTVDLGFHIRVTHPLRLLGVNAPELRTPDGKRVRDEVSKLLPVGTKVVLRSRKYGELEKYGRWLGALYVPGVGDLATVLLDRGWAKPMPLSAHGQDP